MVRPGRLLLAGLLGQAGAALKGFDFLDTDSPGVECSVHGRTGVCMYSMVCTYAGGRHLGTCRDRFIFGSCCRLPGPDSRPEWEERANSLPVAQVCGRVWREPEAAGRIQGGGPANRTAWPWQAGLRIRHSAALSSHHCGAVLLSHHWVATAAHCVYKRAQSKLVVRLGDHSNREKEDGEQERGVDQVVLHPKYSNRNYDNDLALVRLDRPVSFSRFILPICLPRPGLRVQGRRGYVTGWGRTYDGGPRPDLLNQVEVPILTNTECNSLFKLAAVKEQVEEDIWVCAGYREGGKDACEGDSGGPLVVAEGEGKDTVWQLAGIISWGAGSCGEANRPGVYTRVGNYLSWVVRRTEEHPYDWTHYSV